MQACYLSGRKNSFYRLSDVEQVSEVRVEKKSVMFFEQRSQIAARDQLNNLVAIMHQRLADPDLVLAQALEATRVFVPSELVSTIDAILDGYAAQAAREPSQRDVPTGMVPEQSV
jgi:hypothetical protein